MNRTRRRYEIAAAVPVVVVFAALYAWAVDPSEPETAAWLAALAAIPAGLWLFASWLLVYHWWENSGARLSAMDAPGRLLAATVAALPEPRLRWGEAMLGELTQVRGRSARWRFALSCARAALSLPPTAGWPTFAIIAGVAGTTAFAAYLVLGATVPGLGFFAVCFVVLVGAMVALSTARARRVRLSAPVPTVLVTGAVTASIAATAVFLSRHPTAAEALPPGRAALLAAALAGCLWLAVAPPRSLGNGRIAPHLGVGAAVVFVGGFSLAIRANLEGLPLLWLICGPIFIFLVAGFVAAAVDRTFRSGVRAGVWAAISVASLNYALSLPEALRQYASDGVWLFAGDTVSAGFSLGLAMLFSVVIPMIGFPFAVMGATAGAGLRRGGPPARPGVPEGMS